MRTQSFGELKPAITVVTQVNLILANDYGEICLILCESDGGYKLPTTRVGCKEISMIPVDNGSCYKPAHIDIEPNEDYHAHAVELAKGQTGRNVVVDNACLGKTEVSHDAVRQVSFCYIAKVDRDATQVPKLYAFDEWFTLEAALAKLKECHRISSTEQEPSISGDIFLLETFMKRQKRPCCCNH